MKTSLHSKRLIIQVQDVMTIFGVSKETAYRRIKLAKDALGKKKHQQLTITQFCEYYDVPTQEFHQSIFNL
ncbi:hypothetical protein [Nonlabens sp. YIK11]|uniref:hypothetical protein n=1 Tax=Nonlabens sp. YIK11 TaxID=1453349 RepID=UPI0012E2B218|nr:hypothetical protein [Nonlabens sp. YIK11]